MAFVFMVSTLILWIWFPSLSLDHCYIFLILDWSLHGVIFSKSGCNTAQVPFSLSPSHSNNSCTTGCSSPLLSSLPCFPLIPACTGYPLYLHTHFGPQFFCILSFWCWCWKVFWWRKILVFKVLSNFKFYFIVCYLVFILRCDHGPLGPTLFWVSTV